MITYLRLIYFLGELTTDVIAGISGGATGALFILCIFIIAVTIYCYRHRRKSAIAHVRTAVTTTSNTNFSEIENSLYQASIPTEVKLNERGTELPPSYASTLQQYPKNVYTALGKAQFEMQQRSRYSGNHYPNPPPPHPITYYPNPVTLFDADNPQHEYEDVDDWNKPQQNYY